MTTSSNPSRSENGHIQDSPLKQDEPQNQNSNSFALLPGVSSDSLLSILRQQKQGKGTHPPPAGLHQQQHPVFPILSQNDSAPMSVTDIAREAMRLTKETLRNEEKEQGSLTVNMDPLLERKNEHGARENLKTDHSLSSTSEDEAFPLDISKKSTSTKSAASGSLRLNKFVRRLHDMLVQEKEGGIVEWRRGLLVLHNTEVFAKCILPKYFNTRNFKTFRRQLNYYAFIHVRSFSNSGGSSTTALWVNKGLAEIAQQQGADPEDIATVLLLKRAEVCDTAKTVEGRRVRKKMAILVVEEDLGVATKSLQQMQQVQSPHSSKAEQVPTAVSAPLNTYHYQTKHKLVLEHYNHSKATYSKIIPSPTVPKNIHLSNYAGHHHVNDIHLHCGSPQRCVSTSSAEEQRLSAPEAPPRPPTSSTSAANLLLLLSKTQ